MKTRALRISVVAVSLALLASACSADTSELDAANARIAQLEQELFVATSTTVPATETIEGTISLAIGDAVDTISTCRGAGGYKDITAGADVVVRDGTGTIVGSSSLEAGESLEVKIQVGDDPNRVILRQRCVFDFDVEVPGDSDFYEVEVSSRGGLTYTNAEMVEQEWTVIFTLG